MDTPIPLVIMLFEIIPARLRVAETCHRTGLRSNQNSLIKTAVRYRTKYLICNVTLLALEGKEDRNSDNRGNGNAHTGNSDGIALLQTLDGTLAGNELLQQNKGEAHLRHPSVPDFRILLHPERTPSPVEVPLTLVEGRGSQSAATRR